MVGRWMASHAILHFGLCCTPFLVPTLLPNYEKNHYKKHIFSLSGIRPCRYYFFFVCFVCLSFQKQCWRSSRARLSVCMTQFRTPVGLGRVLLFCCRSRVCILFPSGSRYQLWSSSFSLPVCQIQHLGQWPFISKYDAVGKWPRVQVRRWSCFLNKCVFWWRVGAGPTCCSAVVDMSWLCCIWNQWYIPVFVLPFWS